MQVEALKAAVAQHGSKAAAARFLGIPKSTFKDRLNGRPARTVVDHSQIENDRSPNQYIRHLVIPDVQSKPGVTNEHLAWIGQYIADKRPDVIVQIGDFADLPSLSSYDVGKKSFEGRRYKSDLEASHVAMEKLCEPC